MTAKISASDAIKQRLTQEGIRFFANDNIGPYVTDSELNAIEDELVIKFRGVLSTMVIDTDNDHNTNETARRMAKMYIREVFSGRYKEKPNVTDFPNASNLDQVYTVGPIAVRSACSHHFVPIIGQVWIGVHPSNRVMGLSKFHRLTDWIMSRPSIQEEATIALADEIEETIQPLGLGVVFKARHFCCSWRGVKDEGTVMTTSVVRGSLREDPALKAEFFNLIRSNEL